MEVVIKATDDDDNTTLSNNDKIITLSLELDEAIVFEQSQIEPDASLGVLDDEIF